ncbi:ATP-binding protein [Azotobacter beijerinckii]|uniref:ATP-binding protein n=1 Tax=Azotobacter beijerinckii TaxID=170623 RepID=UPI0037BEDB33
MKQHRLIIDASHTHVRAACNWLHETLSRSLTNEKLYELELATSEILTNIVRHACDDAPPTCCIYVTVTIYENMVRVFFVDNGKQMPAFIASSLNDTSRKTTLPDDLDEGGRGIFLIKSCVDKARYRRFGPHNVMLIVSSRE